MLAKERRLLTPHQTELLLPQQVESTQKLLNPVGFNFSVAPAAQGSTQDLKSRDSGVASNRKKHHTMEEEIEQWRGRC